MDAAFVRRQKIGSNIWEFFVRPHGQLAYLPGQYIHVTIDTIDTYRGPQRAFTLTSLPSDELLSFAVKFPSKHSAYKATLLSLETGDKLRVGHSLGDMVLPRDARRPLVLVAGGLGVASFISIIKWLTKQGQQRPIKLMYAHKPAENLFESSIAACPGLVTEHFVSPKHMTVADVTADQSNETLYFISGSESFTLAFRDALLHEQGVSSTNIAYDYFDGYQSTDI
jgi:ferredoxin-NADP reductase